MTPTRSACNRPGQRAQCATELEPWTGTAKADGASKRRTRARCGLDGRSSRREVDDAVRCDAMRQKLGAMRVATGSFSLAALGREARLRLSLLRCVLEEAGSWQLELALSLVAKTLGWAGWSDCSGGCCGGVEVGVSDRGKQAERPAAAARAGGGAGVGVGFPLGWCLVSGVEGAKWCGRWVLDMMMTGCWLAPCSGCWSRGEFISDACGESPPRCARSRSYRLVDRLARAR
jgi:hypothetical protein